MLEWSQIYTNERYVAFIAHSFSEDREPPTFGLTKYSSGLKKGPSNCYMETHLVLQDLQSVQNGTSGHGFSVQAKGKLLPKRGKTLIQEAWWVFASVLFIAKDLHE